uniref:Transcription elongation factor 1 homolog n=1 Tax=Setaria viridis TaxID=4556 RepID=A0A4U6UU60_SETVI|nr:hypothetical protein SEVIR_4G061600v2 [Setaria viridis]TKW20080.1 hypothetical protein SEVIR_4G061600v2 [Setaria viridis]
MAIPTAAAIGIRATKLQPAGYQRLLVASTFLPTPARWSFDESALSRPQTLIVVSGGSSVVSFSATNHGEEEVEDLPKLDTLFTCPFCGYPDAIGCHIDLKDRIAKASCRIYSESYFTSAHALTAPVDVYCEWIDACELANKGVVDCRCRPRLWLKPETTKTMSDLNLDELM